MYCSQQLLTLTKFIIIIIIILLFYIIYKFKAFVLIIKISHPVFMTMDDINQNISLELNINPTITPLEQKCDFSTFL